MIAEEEFLEHLQTAIAENRIVLPTLPEVALRVRDAVEQETTTAQDLSNLVATDAALSARLLQVANSPLYGGRIAINSIQMAITRLGTRMVRSLVVNLAMKQIFQPTTSELDQRLRQLWEDSVAIAAISRTLAQSQPHLDTEQAMLAGLIHNIGALPILTLADDIQELMGCEERLNAILKKLTPIVGQQILETWNFPEALAVVPAHCHDLSYDGGAQADYVDVVLVASLQCSTDAAQFCETAANWNDVPAFKKLGLKPEVAVIEIKGVAEEVTATEQMLAL
ncbi:Predicted signal transduction protein [hydrothermal vent metagenome]|uniref:Predicted signal transduction protein n=1 Tax=hydrothermal vent metagenome TaxID=652676 RepID=A0A3B1APU0_9ZZZZ